MSEKTRLVAAFAILLVSGVVVVRAGLTPQPEPSPEPSRAAYGYDDIRRIRAWPLQGGGARPPTILAPVLTKYSGPAYSLDDFRDDIPEHLPSPTPCDDALLHGPQLTIWTNDRQHLSYLPCAFPAELESLYEDAFAPHKLVPNW